jgi:hypothetical protein
MTFALFALFLLIVIVVVVAWLLYEIRLDKGDRIYPTVPGSQERLPPKSEL